MEITITLPEDIAKAFLANGENLEREVLEATALEGYRQAASFRQTRLSKLSQLVTRPLRSLIEAQQSWYRYPQGRIFPGRDGLIRFPTARAARLH